MKNFNFNYVVNHENAPGMLKDVENTFNCANELKSKMEKDLEARAELVRLINQLYEKQVTILDSNINQLQVGKKKKTKFISI